MADEEHLKTINQGVEAWNAWRRDNLGVDADLSGADLTYANLVGTNFEKATLEGCSVYGISAWDLKLGKANQLSPF